MLYAIGDLHLSLEADKPMDIFGPGWKNYVSRIKYGFSKLREDDLCVICGDLSWSMSLDSSVEDFKFIDSLPGKKIILKGNHDYWWSTATKAKKIFAQNDIATIDILHNNFFSYEDIAICGTRGWFYEEEKGDSHDKKILARELSRLETSLKLADGFEKKYCFFHYPPRYNKYVCTEIVEMMGDYGVRKCYYGHIHGSGHRFAVEGNVDGIYYKMVSADYIGFEPVKVV